MPTNNKSSNLTPYTYPPVTLAYIGDSVFELLVRTWSLKNKNIKSGELHNNVIKIVNAASQAKILGRIMDKLSDCERDVCRRGCNAHVGSVPKSASVGDYHKATGLEALFGFLYLSGDVQRLEEIFEACINSLYE